MSRNHEAVTFLQTLNIKSTLFNGFDRVSVFMALKELSGIYEDILNRERNIYYSEVSALSTQLQQAINFANECQYEKTQMEKQMADIKAEAYAAASDVFQQRQELEVERKQLELERCLKQSEAENERLRMLNEAKAETVQICQQAEKQAKGQRSQSPTPFSVLKGNRNG